MHVRSLLLDWSPVTRARVWCSGPGITYMCPTSPLHIGMWQGRIFIWIFSPPNKLMCNDDFALLPGKVCIFAPGSQAGAIYIRPSALTDAERHGLPTPLPPPKIPRKSGWPPDFRCSFPTAHIHFSDILDTFPRPNGGPCVFALPCPMSETLCDCRRKCQPDTCSAKHAEILNKPLEGMSGNCTGFLFEVMSHNVSLDEVVNRTLELLQMAT
jgi:hypothetical protein